MKFFGSFDATFASAEERQARLRQWNFDCTCEVSFLWLTFLWNSFHYETCFKTNTFCWSSRLCQNPYHRQVCNLPTEELAGNDKSRRAVALHHQLIPRYMAAWKVYSPTTSKVIKNVPFQGWSSTGRSNREGGSDASNQTWHGDNDALGSPGGGANVVRLEQIFDIGGVVIVVVDCHSHSLETHFRGILMWKSLKF